MPWGQLVCGPPGSGKTTYCTAMYEHLNRSGRPTIIVNLDPANDALPYPCAVNVLDLIALEDVTAAYELGPNGGLIFCLEYLQANLDWLEAALAPHAAAGAYVIFDCPGQAELFTHHGAFAAILHRLQKQLDFRLACVHLLDAHHVSDAGKFISAALLSLTAMIRLELPHVNVLSKIDMAEAYGQAAFELDFYTDCPDLSRLLDCFPGQGEGEEDEEGNDYDHDHDLDHDGMGEGDGDEHPVRAELDADGADAEEASGAGTGRGATAGEDNDKGTDGGADDADKPNSNAEANEAAVRKLLARRKDKGRPFSRFLRRHRALNEKLVEVIHDYNLLSFTPVSVQAPDTLQNLLKTIDSTIGFVPVRGAAVAGDAGAAAAAFIASKAQQAHMQQQQQYEQEQQRQSMIAGQDGWDFERRAGMAERFQRGRFGARIDERDAEEEDEEGNGEDGAGGGSSADPVGRLWMAGAAGGGVVERAAAGESMASKGGHGGKPARAPS